MVIVFHCMMFACWYLFEGETLYLYGLLFQSLSFMSYVLNWFQLYIMFTLFITCFLYNLVSLPPLAFLDKNEENDIVRGRSKYMLSGELYV